MWSGCISSELERGDEFCKCTISAITQGSGQNCQGQGGSHSDCASLDPTTMVLDNVKDVCESTFADPESPLLLQARTIRVNRTKEEQEMDDCSFQSFWRQQTEGWSEEVRKLILEGPTKKSTQYKYKQQLQRLVLWCKKKERSLPFYGKEEDIQTLAEYMEALTRPLERPESTLKALRAAVHDVCEGLNIISPMDDKRIYRLYKTLIGKRTLRPLVSRAPVNAGSISMFWKSQPPTKDLSEEELRAKAMSLLALVLMMRPSDLARADRFLIIWESGPSCRLTLWGHKTDKGQVGNDSMIHPHPDRHLCPVRTLRWYLKLTTERVLEAVRLARDKWKRKQGHLPQEKQQPFVESAPVFIHLKGALSLAPSSCSKILKEVAVKAGLDPRIFSGGGFRSGGANAALQNGLEERDVRGIGRWKSEKVFFENYVRTNAPDSTSAKILDVGLREQEQAEQVNDGVEGHNSSPTIASSSSLSE